MDIAEFVAEAEAIVSRAGELVKKCFFEAKTVSQKSTFADLVTETDKAAEQLIANHLREKFKDHCFIGEESATGDSCVLTDNPTWILDPIDGTTNFVHRFPYCGISLALLINKVIEFGIVYNPITSEIYQAQRGKGAFLNGQKLLVSHVTKLNDALVCAEFGSSRDDTIIEKKLNSMKAVIKKAHGIRSLGSAALNMCSVASGKTNAYWEYGIHVWDIAAGCIIVKEAGGVLNCTDGSDLDIFGRKILCAGTEELAHEISTLLDDISLTRD